MAVVGSAEVVVRAITAQVKRDIEKAFKDAAPAAKAAGQNAGRDWSDSFGQAVGQNIKGSIGNAFDGVDASRFGRDAGRSFADGAAGGIGGGGGRIGGAAEREFGDGGRRAGNSFNRALNSAWADAAVAASRAFTTIFALGNIGGTAISGLVSAISAVVSGLFSIVSAAGAAAGAIAVLPGLFGAALQAGGALKLAFSGVGAALSAGMKPAAASVGAAATKSYALADAQKALGRAYQDAARAKYDADRRVAQASGDVADAEQNLLDITKQLNAARRQAAEDLQQLGFDAEDAALAEQRAALNLEDAHAKLVAAQSLPPDDKNRREAELAFKEADLAYREAKDRNSDLAKEQDKAAKAGIEGSSAVLDVKQQIADAEDQLASREQALADARLDRQRTMADSAQRIADAQEAVRRAQEAANAATGAGTRAAGAYATALSNLSPPAREFVKYLISLRDEFGALKAAAGAELFPKLQQSIQPIVDKLFPVLETQLRQTGSILGDFALGLSSAATRGSTFENLLKSQNKTLNIFNRQGSNGRTVIDDLATVALRLLTAIQPLTQRFARWVATLIEGWEAATDTGREMDKLTGFFNKAGDRAALLGSITGNLIGIFLGLGRAASPAGTGLLKSFDAYTKKLKEFVNGTDGQTKLKRYFDDVAVNMRALADLARVAGKAFGALGDNKGIADFATAIQPAVKNIGKVIDQMTAGGGGLAELINNLSELAVVFADTGGIKLFFNVINAGLKPIVAFAQSDFGGKFLVFAGALTAGARALSFMGIVGGKALKILAGGPIKLLRVFQALKNDGIRAAIKELFNLGPASDNAKSALERQMVTDKAKTEVLKALEHQAIETGAALERLGEKGAPTPADKAAGKAAAPAAAAGAVAVPDVDVSGTTSGLASVGTAMDDVGGKKAGKFKTALGGIGKAFKGLGSGIMGLVGGPFGLLLTALPLAIAAFTALYKKSPEFKAFVDGIVKAVKPVIEFIGKFLVEALDKFFAWVNDKMPAIKGFFGDVFKAISGFITGTFIPVWNNYFVPAFQTAWNIIRPILGFLWKAVQFAFTAIKFYVTNILIPYWTLVWKVIQAAWTIIKPIIGFLWKAIQVAFTLIKGYVTNILVPYIRLVWKIIQTMWNIAKPIFQALLAGVRVAFSGIKAVWENVLRPAFSAIKAVVSGLWNKVFKPPFNAIKSGVTSVWHWITDKFNAIVDMVSGIPGRLSKLGSNFLQAGKDLMGKIIDGLKSVGSIGVDIGTNLFNGVIGAINVAIRAVNDFLPDKVSIKGLPDIDLPNNPIPEIHKLAKGGVVTASPGGTLAVIGEAGRNERVEPLDGQGFSKRDRAMVDMMRAIANGTGGGDTFHVHPAPGMDEAALAAMVSRRVAWRRSVGT